MARPVRVQYEGAVYRVTSRGNERKAIFKGEPDRKLFLKTLREAAGQYGLVVRCYCLMPNHYHLVVETPRANLSSAMAWFQSTYTNRYNHKHRRSGHLYQGRYKAHIVEADSYAIQLIRYIHLNPIRSGKKNDPLSSEKKKDLEQYLWSTHSYYCGRKKAPEWINLDWLSYWAKSARQAQKLYRKDIDEAFEKSLASPWQNLRGGLVLGSEELWQKVWDTLDGKTAKHEVHWKEYQGRQEIECQINEWVSKEKDSRVKMWIRARLGGERLVDIARQEGYCNGVGVYQVVNRLERKAKQDRELKQKLDELRKMLIVMR